MRINKIVITTSSFGEYDSSPLDLCRKGGLSVIVNPYKRKINSDELIELAKDAAGIIAGTELITEEVLSRLKYLKVISRCGAGIDNIDVNAAARLGIKVFNTPDAPTLAVAELTVGMILGLLRKIQNMDIMLKKGVWKKMMGNLLYQKNIGLIGFGRIGRKVAELLKPFGCSISYADPFIEDGLHGFSRLSMHDLLAWADIISLHVSAKGKLLGEKEFPLMKKGAWLVNTSRGDLVDEEVLLAYLREGKLAGAAIDVFQQEPYSGVLKTLDNVILTPHIGSYAKEARVMMEMQAVENLLRGFQLLNESSIL